MIQMTNQIPVLIGPNYQHVMGTAETWETDDDYQVTISVKAYGREAKDLIAIMNSSEQLAVQFVAIPVTPRNTPSEEKI